jgi:hypothetical protein
VTHTVIVRGTTKPRIIAMTEMVGLEDSTHLQGDGNDQAIVLSSRKA